MPGHAVFFGGSGHDVESDKFTYKQWCSRFEAIQWSAKRYSGVGVDNNRTFKTSEATGAGWAAIIKEAMNDIGRLNIPPKNFCIVGQSRGGVQANVLAHCISHWATHQQEVPFCPNIFIFAIDPVEGWNAANSGSFDFRADRGFKGIRTQRFGKIGFNLKLSNLGRQSSRYSRDQLRQDYSLDEDAASKVHPAVQFYLSVIMQFRGSNRKHGIKHGFTPQMIDQNFSTGQVSAKSYVLQGDHGYGVYTGIEGAKPLKISRRARGRVAYDMLVHHLKLSDICQLAEEVDQLGILDDYALIALEDLEGRQVDGGKSGYSFLQSETSQNNTASATSRWHSGRGHLVSSSNLGDRPFVNERHSLLWKANENRILRMFEGGRVSSIEELAYEHLGDWLKWKRR